MQFVLLVPCLQQILERIRFLFCLLMRYHITLIVCYPYQADGIGKFNQLQVKAKLSVWTPESKNTLISNLATESGWLSKQTIIENSPHAAPDEVERKKKEDELTTQNVASNSGNVVQTTTNQNI